MILTFHTFQCNKKCQATQRGSNVKFEMKATAKMSQMFCQRRKSQVCSGVYLLALGNLCPVFGVQCGENYGPGQESCRVQPSQELGVHSNILEHIVRGKTVLQ